MLDDADMEAVLFNGYRNYCVLSIPRGQRAVVHISENDVQAAIAGHPVDLSPSIRDELLTVQLKTTVPVYLDAVLESDHCHIVDLIAHNHGFCSKHRVARECWLEEHFSRMQHISIIRSVVGEDAESLMSEINIDYTQVQQLLVLDKRKGYVTGESPAHTTTAWFKDTLPTVNLVVLSLQQLISDSWLL